jgi:hypothetical protein
MEKTFKIWNYEENDWVKDNFEDYLIINWYLSNDKQEGECFVNIIQGVDAIIVWPNENGEFLTNDIFKTI